MMHENKTTDLIGYLSPPIDPLDSDGSNQARNEAVLRIKFPDDYLEFGRVYGSGTILAGYSWEVWSPFRLTYPLIVMEFSRICNIFREAMEISDVPFGIFPEVGGVLPFANTSDGGWVCWRTQGDPNEWDVVDLQQYENGAYEILNLGFSEYFFAVLTRNIVLKRHANGDTWDPQKDLIFKQRVFVDKGL